MNKTEQDFTGFSRLQIAKILEKTMRCNCDLDNWEPEISTGHSCVCRIHKAAMVANNESIRNR